MSKSLTRVIRALADHGVQITPLEMGDQTRTAQQAADAAGCALDQIAKSVIFAGQTSGRAILFITAGGNQVDSGKASVAAGEPLAKADAGLIRVQTGFAIGGVAPIGHLSPVRAFSMRACWISRKSGPQQARHGIYSPSRRSNYCRFLARRSLISLPYSP